jgi:16S rRNA (cytosine967-C5)-methyltransferase
LDLCAAPGGKTAVLAEAGAKVTACDISEFRLALLKEGVERLGHSESVEVLLRGPEEPAPEGPFDAVLIDAPCSNTGVLGARPGARWRWGPASRRSLEEVQSSLLERAAPVVRPGGRLIWSTCSLEPGENEQCVARFLASHGGWKLDEEQFARPASSGSDGPVDGGYAARLLAP